MSAKDHVEREQAQAQGRELGRAVDRLVREIIIAQDALDRARAIAEEDRPPRPPEQPRRHRWRFPF